VSATHWQNAISHVILQPTLGDERMPLISCVQQQVMHMSCIYTMVHIIDIIYTECYNMMCIRVCMEYMNVNVMRCDSERLNMCLT